MNQLALIEQMNPVEIYGSGKIEDILKKIESETKTKEIDISTKQGRDELASLAYKIARSKTFLDDLGKKLGEDAKKQLDAINAERKKARDFLDNLKDDIRKPLTEWENKEKNRIQSHETAISEIISIRANVLQNWQILPLYEVETKINFFKTLNREWDEFKQRADKEIEMSIQVLVDARNNIVKRDNEKAELERLKTQEAARIQKEREEQIAKEAAERAKKEAEEIAERIAREKQLASEAEAKILEQKRLDDLAKLEKERRDAEEKAARAVKEKKDAEERAKQAAIKAEEDKKRAIEAERKKIEQEKLLAQQEELKRENNKKHAAKINNEIAKALMNVGSNLDESLAKLIVIDIVKGKIPHLKVLY
jgi:hypothetical protein